MLLTSIQLSLAVSAWSDLAKRPPEAVNGSQKSWAAIIAISFVGPGAYYRRGRGPVRPASSSAPGWPAPVVLSAPTGTVTPGEPGNMPSPMAQIAD